jgi:hypothetical protein
LQRDWALFTPIMNSKCVSSSSLLRLVPTKTSHTLHYMVPVTLVDILFLHLITPQHWFLKILYFVEKEDGERL